VFRRRAGRAIRNWRRRRVRSRQQQVDVDGLADPGHVRALVRRRRGLAADDEAPQPDPEQARSARELEAGHPFHDLVGEQDLVRRAVEHLERRHRGLARVDVVSLRPEHPGENPERHRVVIDQKDSHRRTGLTIDERGVVCRHSPRPVETLARSAQAMARLGRPRCGREGNPVPGAALLVSDTPAVAALQDEPVVPDVPLVTDLDSTRSCGCSTTRLCSRSSPASSQGKGTKMEASKRLGARALVVVLEDRARLRGSGEGLFVEASGGTARPIEVRAAGSEALNDVVPAVGQGEASPGWIDPADLVTRIDGDERRLLFGEGVEVEGRRKEAGKHRRHSPRDMPRWQEAHPARAAALRSHVGRKACAPPRDLQQAALDSRHDRGRRRRSAARARHRRDARAG